VSLARSPTFSLEIVVLLELLDLLSLPLSSSILRDPLRVFSTGFESNRPQSPAQLPFIGSMRCEVEIRFPHGLRICVSLEVMADPKVCMQAASRFIGFTAIRYSVAYF
jgi:hypothetical protein